MKDTTHVKQVNVWGYLKEKFLIGFFSVILFFVIVLLAALWKAPVEPEKSYLTDRQDYNVRIRVKNQLAKQHGEAFLGGMFLATGYPDSAAVYAHYMLRYKNPYGPEPYRAEWHTDNYIVTTDKVILKSERVKE